ncbi:murein biosynthesis integral membrane protein MurJ [Candidatus Dependentiae bacterium]
MTQILDKKSILRKTAQVGATTLLSRFLGIAREILRARFLGVGAVSDAFIMAYKIPHFLRRIFAEGALSASFIPVFIKKTKNKELKNANGLMSISFLFFEGIVFLLCLLVAIWPKFVIKAIAPGFSVEQIGYAIPFLRILFPMIFFISSSALFAGALNSVNHFFIPAFGPVLMNIVFVATLILCLTFKLSPIYLCMGILFSGLLVFLMHFAVYIKYNFGFAKIDKSSRDAFSLILKKFLPTLAGVSIIEINLFFDCIIASFLPKGSVSLLEYSGRFMNVPIGVFAVGFATILLPQFSRFVLYAPKRLNFYLLEVIKFVTFLIIPAMLFMMFIADPIFSILMLKGRTSLHSIWIAKWLLIIYLSGLCFYCLNKVLVNVFYSFHDTKTPTIALVISSLVNLGCNVIGLKLWGVFGIAGSTAISAVVLTFLCFLFLKLKYKFKFYAGNYFLFLIRYVVQLFFACAIFVTSYLMIFKYLKNTTMFLFFYQSWGYWLIVFPLIFISAFFIFLTRNLFGIKLYFLSK